MAGRNDEKNVVSPVFVKNINLYMSIDAINSANFCKENTSVNGYNDLIRYRPV